MNKDVPVCAKEDEQPVRRDYVAHGQCGCILDGWAADLPRGVPRRWVLQ
jgi:hypothetical protein